MKIEFTPKQQEFADALFSGEFKYLLFGGAIRGGKTYAVLCLVLLLCKVFPGSRWAIVRKDLPTLKRTTFKSFNKIRPSHFCGDINQSTWTATCTNGSEILFFPESLKQDPDLDRWKGLEVNGFFFEEMNECSEDSFAKAIERAGSWSVPGDEQPPVVIAGTCNPSKGWVKRRFYDPWKIDKLLAPWYYLPSKITDNPHLEPAYIESLMALKDTNPKAFERFVEGNWETADEPDQLMPSEWLEAAKDVEPVSGKNSLGVDVARFGADDTSVVFRNGNRCTRIEYFEQQSTDRTADVVQAYLNDGPIDADRCFVDVVGLGGGVVDNLVRNGFDVVPVVGGATAPVTDTFYTFFNMRSYLWWSVREAFRKGEICLEYWDSRLLEDLTAPRYSISGDKMIRVESKDDIKARLGRSPDAGDAFIYAWAEIDEDDDELVVF